MDLIREFTSKYVKREVPNFNPGDTVRVQTKVKEGDKERLQTFQGTVIKKKGGGTAETFTVRKLSGGVGVERIFPLYSPNLTKIEVVKRGKVRRAKLYYLRKRKGKAAKVKEKTI